MSELVNSNGHFVQRPAFNALPLKKDMEGTIPQFFTQEVPTDQVDPTTGLKIYRVIECVRILIPGDKGSAPVRRLNDELKAYYGEAYRKWKNSGVADADMIGDGIPLKLWPGIAPAIAKGLEHINIFTVQQLAGLADGRCSQPGTIGLRDLREKAKAFLESASKTAPVAALQAQIDSMKEREALRDKQLEEMIERNNELQAQLMASQGGVVSDKMPELTTPRGRQQKGNT